MDIRVLETPAATPTHVPIPHFRLVDMLRHTLGFYGHQITEEHHGVTKDGLRYFGLLSLRSPYTGYEDTVGLRNSHDKSFPISVGYGARVFVCDNLSFIAEHVVRRKHTANAKRDLPALVGELVEPLTEQREAQHNTFEQYKATALTNMSADHAIMELYRHDVLNLTRIPDVVQQWEHPKYEEWGDKTAWRLFNAVTFALNGRVAENPCKPPGRVGGGDDLRMHEILGAGIRPDITAHGVLHGGAMPVRGGRDRAFVSRRERCGKVVDGHGSGFRKRIGLVLSAHRCGRRSVY